MTESQQVLRWLQPALGAMTEASLLACDGVLARVWLAAPGDICDSCPMRPECRDRTTCLHLVASAGLTTRLDGPFRRFPIGARLVGRIPVTHQAVIAREGLADLGVADPAWLALHGVTAFAALPLDHGERCIGVTAVFSRGALPEAQVRLIEAAVKLGAEAIGNIGAYRLLAVERNRLAAANARLRGGTAHVEPAPPYAGDEPRAVPTLAEIQREGILRALERTRWRVSGPNGAAALLGLRPTTLESKLKKLGIQRPPR